LPSEKESMLNSVESRRSLLWPLSL
jgi:hypothetical protein